MRKVVLDHSLSGYPPYEYLQREDIPKGAELIVSEPDYSDTEWLVLWEDQSLLVDKESLKTFEIPE